MILKKIINCIRGVLNRLGCGETTIETIWNKILICRKAADNLMEKSVQNIW